MDPRKLTPLARLYVNTASSLQPYYPRSTVIKPEQLSTPSRKPKRMAPDINSMPTSPRLDRVAVPSQPASDTASRRSSHTMGPPAVPASAHRTHSTSHHQSPTLFHMSPVTSNSEQAGVPLRHPRPLTAAELYLECEKEQEAVVNRLTRELTALRAQSASVASNTSHSSTSTSASLLPIDISDPNPTHQMTGATHPTPSRRHRSSSSLSMRSTTTPSTNLSTTGSSATNLSTQVQAPSSTTSAAPLGSMSQASADRAAASARGATNTPLSRRPSTTTTASGRSTPARRSIELSRPHAAPALSGSGGGTLYTLPHRPSLSRDASYSSQTTSSTVAHAGTPFPISPPPQQPLQSPIQQQSPSQSLHTAMQHVADTAAHRSEMEIVKAENEALRQRVRGLERALRARRRGSSQSDAAMRSDIGASAGGGGAGRVLREREASSAAEGRGVIAWATDGGVGGVAGPRDRSESQGTSASASGRRGGGGGVGQGDDEVRVGESAGSGGIGRAG